MKSVENSQLPKIRMSRRGSARKVSDSKITTKKCCNIPNFQEELSQLWGLLRAHAKKYNLDTAVEFEQSMDNNEPKNCDQNKDLQMLRLLSSSVKDAVDGREDNTGISDNGTVINLRLVSKDSPAKKLKTAIDSLTPRSEGTASDLSFEPALDSSKNRGQCETVDRQNPQTLIFSSSTEKTVLKKPTPIRLRPRGLPQPMKASTSFSPSKGSSAFKRISRELTTTLTHKSSNFNDLINSSALGGIIAAQTSPFLLSSKFSKPLIMEDETLTKENYNAAVVQLSNVLFHQMCRSSSSPTSVPPLFNPENLFSGQLSKNLGSTFNRIESGKHKN